MIQSDRYIRAHAAEKGMIEPFEYDLIRKVDAKKVLSYGCSSYGYDCRLSPKEFLIFRHVPGTIINPKRFNPANLEEVPLHSDKDGDYFILPAHSYGLGVALERIKMPPDITGVCIGKSTYARCFTGDTKVKLVDGDFTFCELIERAAKGERLYGFGVLDGAIVAQELVAPRFIEDSDVLEITLDNGQSVKSTPEHVFMLKDGTTKQAQHLRSGDSLHAVYDWTDHGYPGVYDPVFAKFQEAEGLNRRSARTSVHRMVAKDILQNADMCVHHIDGNKLNNHPDNLALMTASEHLRLHNEEDNRHVLGGLKSKEKFETDEEHREKILAALHSQESKQKAHAGRRWYLGSEANTRSLCEGSAKRWRQPDAKAKQSAVAKAGMAALKRRDDITEESLTNALLASGTIRGAARMLNVDRSAFRRFQPIVDAFRSGTLAGNHKVQSVQALLGTHPTFCLTAPKTGNFALSAGVFVHNCGVIANLTPIESGWEGHLTLEFSNSSGADCRLYANEGICQILFFKGDPCSVSYEDRKGKYQGQGESVTTAKV
jgi:deoxycytidine triphosphate deaminase